jgi:FimV-like protein
VAKPSSSAGRHREGRPGPAGPTGGASPPESASSPSLNGARAAVSRGDIRTARRLASEAARTGTEADRQAAQRLLASLGPDPAALLAAGLVLFALALTAWLTLFRLR